MTGQYYENTEAVQKQTWLQHIEMDFYCSLCSVGRNGWTVLEIS
jgi:hypothetical protein